jgi:acetolactate synthase-1/2/3 large subunit
MVLDSQDIKEVMDTAIREATTGRPGPVWIDIPMDVQAQEVKIC